MTTATATPTFQDRVVRCVFRFNQTESDFKCEASDFTLAVPFQHDTTTGDFARGLNFRLNALVRGAIDTTQFHPEVLFLEIPQQSKREKRRRERELAQQLAQQQRERNNNISNAVAVNLSPSPRKRLQSSAAVPQQSTSAVKQLQSLNDGAGYDAPLPQLEEQHRLSPKKKADMLLASSLLTGDGAAEPGYDEGEGEENEEAEEGFEQQDDDEDDALLLVPATQHVLNATATNVSQDRAEAGQQQKQEREEPSQQQQQKQNPLEILIDDAIRFTGKRPIHVHFVFRRGANSTKFNADHVPPAFAVEDKRFVGHFTEFVETATSADEDARQQRRVLVRATDTVEDVIKFVEKNTRRKVQRVLEPSGEWAISPVDTLSRVLPIVQQRFIHFVIEFMIDDGYRDEAVLAAAFVSN